MKTAVVILNWNTEGFLKEFLPPLLRSINKIEGAEVVVADNASTDGSMKVMAEMFPEVKTLTFSQNYGFTGGYNKAFDALYETDKPEYFVLINSDIEVTDNWLQPLVDWMDSHPECGACAPKLHSFQEKEKFEYAGAAGGYLDRYGYPFCRGRVLKRLETDHGQYDTPADVMWATGACLLVRSSVYKALNGLDNRFFAHMEEIDLCWRMAVLHAALMRRDAKRAREALGALSQALKMPKATYFLAVLLMDSVKRFAVSPSAARRRFIYNRDFPDALDFNRILARAEGAGEETIDEWDALSRQLFKEEDESQIKEGDQEP